MQRIFLIIIFSVFFFLNSYAFTSGIEKISAEWKGFADKAVPKYEKIDRDKIEKTGQNTGSRDFENEIKELDAGNGIKLLALSIYM